ncbi:MAG: argininosuccinate lyase [Leptospirales bacterium]
MRKEQGKNSSQKLWGGRFSESTDQEVERFTESLSFDRELWRHDIRGSRAHAAMLARIQLLSAEEERQIQEGFTRIEEEIESGAFPFREAYEDIHMNIEQRLYELIGTPARKIHTARSRNDQVALDLRLYVLEKSHEMVLGLGNLVRAALWKARQNRNLILPGYTHLQQAQPLSGSYYFVAHAERFLRDRMRFLDVIRRTDRSPLGSGALAGTTLPIDRIGVARDLGFSGVTGNGLDSVSDRDFIVDFLHASVLVSVHLSGWAEEWILWSTREFGFIRIPDRYMTGSSMMPQKKNPDVLELIRGKTGRVLGDYVGIVTLLKGLPMAYNRDLQEDKEKLFDAAETVQKSVSILTRLVGESAFVEEKIAQALSGSELLATDMAEDLVRWGTPFREAHEIIGRIVAFAEQSRKSLSSLSDKELNSFSPLFPAGYSGSLTLEGSIARRNHAGGPAMERVDERILEIEKELEILA